MGSSNIRDLLTAFSPFWDFFAISAGDGRIKVLTFFSLSKFVFLAVENQGFAYSNWVFEVFSSKLKKISLYFRYGTL